jgi:hypothetical protein
MFGFWRTSKGQRLSSAVTKAFAAQGIRAGVDPASLEMVQQNGSYAGRKVNRFRIYDPAVATTVRKYVDLDSHPELVIGAGHVEQEGVVVLHRAEAARGTSPERYQATRADHVDDAQFVRPNTETATPPPGHS